MKNKIKKGNHCARICFQSPFRFVSIFAFISPTLPLSIFRSIVFQLKRIEKERKIPFEESTKPIIQLVEVSLTTTSSFIAPIGTFQ